MSLYEGARVIGGISCETQLFAILVDMVTEGAREGLMNEILYADNLVLTRETMENLRVRFRKWDFRVNQRIDVVELIFFL